MIIKHNDRNRRQDERVDGPWKGDAQVKGQTRNCTVVNLSAGGALLEGLGDVPAGESITLSVEGLGSELNAAVVSSSQNCLHISFDLDDSTAGKLGSFLRAKGAQAA